MQKSIFTLSLLLSLVSFLNADHGPWDGDVDSTERSMIIKQMAPFGDHGNGGTRTPYTRQKTEPLTEKATQKKAAAALKRRNADIHPGLQHSDSGIELN